jgi:hypothetical protein
VTEIPCPAEEKGSGMTPFFPPGIEFPSKSARQNWPLLNRHC